MQVLRAPRIAPALGRADVRFDDYRHPHRAADGARLRRRGSCATPINCPIPPSLSRIRAWSISSISSGAATGSPSTARPTPTLLGLLFQMNDAQNVNRSLGLSNANVGVDQPRSRDRRRLCGRMTRTRFSECSSPRSRAMPTDREMALVMQRRSRSALSMAQRPAMGAAQQARFRVQLLRP